MHPYKMQRLIKDRGKGQVINVGQRASLYQTINQLLKADLITFWETTHQEGFPDRTVYRVTDKGHEAAVAWLREMLATPAQEFPVFPAAVSLLPLLTLDDALSQMGQREDNLTAQIEAIQAELESLDLPKLFTLESAYMLAVLEAELKWVRGLIADIRSGEITWNQDWMHPTVPLDPQE